MREGEIERVRQRYAPCFRRGDRLKLVRAEKFEEPRNKIGSDKGTRQGRKTNGVYGTIHRKDWEGAVKDPCTGEGIDAKNQKKSSSSGRVRWVQVRPSCVCWTEGFYCLDDVCLGTVGSLNSPPELLRSALTWSLLEPVLPPFRTNESRWRVPRPQRASIEC